jgi:MDMPI C-terminal domain
MTTPASATGLAAIDHVVVLMRENRWFDHLLGFRHAGGGNVSPTGAWDARMAHETSAHRHDVERLPGPPTAIDTSLAVDGMDEVLMLMLGSAWGDPPVTSDPGSRVVVSSPQDRWEVTLGLQRVDVTRATSGDAVACVAGEPSEVLLWLWGRAPYPAVEGEQTTVGHLDAGATEAAAAMAPSRRGALDQTYGHWHVSAFPGQPLGRLSALSPLSEPTPRDLNPYPAASRNAIHTGCLVAARSYRASKWPVLATRSNPTGPDSAFPQVRTCFS